MNEETQTYKERKTDRQRERDRDSLSLKDRDREKKRKRERERETMAFILTNEAPCVMSPCCSALLVCSIVCAL